MISMAQHKTAGTPLQLHWNNCSLLLSHRDDVMLNIHTKVWNDHDAPWHFLCILCDPIGYTCKKLRKSCWIVHRWLSARLHNSTANVWSCNSLTLSHQLISNLYSQSSSLEILASGIKPPYPRPCPLVGERSAVWMGLIPGYVYLDVEPWLGVGDTGGCWEAFSCDVDPARWRPSPPWLRGKSFSDCVERKLSERWMPAMAAWLSLSRCSCWRMERLARPLARAWRICAAMLEDVEDSDSSDSPSDSPGRSPEWFMVPWGDLIQPGLVGLPSWRLLR